MLSHCHLKVVSNCDYRRAQSALRSTDDFNFVGLITVYCFLFLISAKKYKNEITLNFKSPSCFATDISKAFILVQFLFYVCVTLWFPARRFILSCAVILVLIFSTLF